MRSGDTETIGNLRRHCDEIKDTVSDTYHRVHDQLRDGDTSAMSVLYVYVNMLQETQEMVSSIRKYLRAFAKLRDSGVPYPPGKNRDADSIKSKVRKIVPKVEMEDLFFHLFVLQSSERFNIYLIFPI